MHNTLSTTQPATSFTRVAVSLRLKEMTCARFTLKARQCAGSASMREAHGTWMTLIGGYRNDSSMKGYTLRERLKVTQPVPLAILYAGLLPWAPGEVLGWHTRRRCCTCTQVCSTLRLPTRSYDVHGCGVFKDCRITLQRV